MSTYDFEPNPDDHRPEPPHISGSAPKQPWQALTKEEVLAALTSVDPETKRLPSGFRDFASVISEALRRKNERS